MPSVTKTFDYTGTVQSVVIPAGTTSIDLFLWGGAGGGGGGDAAGPGRSGAAGHHVKKETLSVTSNIGETLTLGVGGGGAGGGGGGNAPGGASGRSLTGYSGGVGGKSGGSGSSGAGGGGGGATVVLFNSVEIAIAGGGGGGSGDGQHSQGTVGVNTNSATSNSPSTLGENGKDHSGDGAGGGAGGGGDAGGKGGNGGSGDHGGTGGFSGSNLVPSSGSESNGSGITPGGTGESHYAAGIAVGGGAGQSGGNGKAVIIFNISVNANYKVGGEWKTINEIKYKVGGQWKPITAAFTKVSGSWKALFNTGIDFNQTSTTNGFAAFGDSSGSTASGSGGSGGGGGGRVICTWLQAKGMFDKKDLEIDTLFSVKHLSRTVKIGYWFWALPLVDYMNKSSDNKSWFGGLVIETISILAQARANELAYQMGEREKGDILGKFTRWIGESFCWMVGVTVRPFVEHRFGDWLEIYDPDIR